MDSNIDELNLVCTSYRNNYRFIKKDSIIKDDMEKSILKTFFAQYWNWNSAFMNISKIYTIIIEWLSLICIYQRR